METRDHFKDFERQISISQAQSPCLMLRGRKAYFLNNLDSMPSGPSLKKPLLVAKPQRYVVRSISSSPETYDYYVEVSVTSRGEPSVAKDWTLCLVYEEQPFRYQPQEIAPSDIASFQDKTLLEESAVHAPIKRGEAVVGWLLFRVPQNRITDKPLVGSLEYRDYLEHPYSTGFGAPKSSESPRKGQHPPPGPGLRAEVK